MYNNRPVSIGGWQIFTPAVVIFCVLLGIGYGAVAWMPGFVKSWCVLSGGNILNGKIWTLVTYSFFNTCGFPLAWDILVLLFMASALENKWGAKSWIILWVVMSVTCGLLYIAVGAFVDNIVVSGSGPCVYGMIGAFGLTFRHNLSYSFLGTIKAHHGALIMIGIGVLLSLPQPITLIDVAGAGLAYCYLKLLWKWGQRKTQGPAVSTKSRKPGAFVDID